MKKVISSLVLFLIILQSCTELSTQNKTQSEPISSDYHLNSSVPDLVMPENGLKFKEIEDYKNYKIVATHFRTDKKELRYILANEAAFKAYKDGSDFPNGSKVVKIGWNVAEMSNFNPALEAKEVQRIEYMLKDEMKFAKNPGNWGYARFVKKEGKYQSWQKGTQTCVSCHNLAKDKNFLFTELQKLQ